MLHGYMADINRHQVHTCSFWQAGALVRLCSCCRLAVQGGAEAPYPDLDELYHHLKTKNTKTQRHTLKGSR